MKRSQLLTGLIALALLLMAGVTYSIQLRASRHMRAEIQTLRTQWDDLSARLQTGPTTSPRPASTIRVIHDSDPAAETHRRLAQMEESLAQLADSMDYLMERGQLPLSATKLQDLARRFADISLPDQDRLRALRLLERNGGLTDDLVLQAVGWLQTSPNARTRRDLLRQMDDLDHETLKAPMLGLLSTETDSNVREELVDNLGRFASDPQVEAQLWDVMNNDPDPEVREEAEDALRREPMSRERVASLQDRALSPDATMEERLLAIQATQRQDEKSPEFMAVMGELVQLTQDPVDRARMFRAFDGTTDPALKQPLLNGLQDPSPVVREEAVDALSDYRDDPAIDQWLRYLMDNDPDPRVQREAFNTISNRD